MSAIVAAFMLTTACEIDQRRMENYVRVVFGMEFVDGLPGEAIVGGTGVGNPGQMETVAVPWSKTTNIPEDHGFLAVRLEGVTAEQRDLIVWIEVTKVVDNQAGKPDRAQSRPGREVFVIYEFH